MRNYWIIADSHFGHKKLIEKGFRPKGFEERIMKNLKCIEDDDVLIHLGDVFWSNTRYWMPRFMQTKGKKWLVKGNHDVNSSFYYMDWGFDFVADYIGMEIFGQKILFSHIPQPLHDYDVNIHGHLHDFSDKRMAECKNVLTKNHILVKMEHDYRPVTLKTLLKRGKNDMPRVRGGMWK